MTDNLKASVISHLKNRHSSLFQFWTSGGVIPQTSIEAHCDMVYTMYLLGILGDIAQESVESFCIFAAKKNLPGWQPQTSEPPLSVHNCAYLFGALNLLGTKTPLSNMYDLVLGKRKADIGKIVDTRSHLPTYPARWAHHNWRVSHWLGGTPSLLISLERSGSTAADPFHGLAGLVRSAVEALIDPETGLIRAYRSDALQWLFRAAYRLRHDPDLGDLGGIAHVLWVDHVLGRPYTAPNALLDASRNMLNRHAPFMEGAPYCLDFDIVQIVRTAGVQLGEVSDQDRSRAIQMMADIAAYFEKPDDGYTLHKLPGALATYHECALIACKQLQLTPDGSPLDIIRSAYWL